MMLEFGAVDEDTMDDLEDVRNIHRRWSLV